MDNKRKLHPLGARYIEPNPEDKDRHWFDIIRDVFPKATDDECDYLLWNETGFPYFWNIPEDGQTPADCARTQLRKLKENEHV